MTHRFYRRNESRREYVADPWTNGQLLDHAFVDSSGVPSGCLHKGENSSEFELQAEDGGVWRVAGDERGLVLQVGWCAIMSFVRPWLSRRTIFSASTVRGGLAAPVSKRMTTPRANPSPTSFSCQSCRSSVSDTLDQIIYFRCHGKFLFRRMMRVLQQLPWHCRAGDLAEHTRSLRSANR
jgi:hypothetical protein